MYASVDQAKEIYSLFRARKDFFPHTRFDYLKRKISANECIYLNDVVITFSRYKRAVKLGECNASKGDYCLHQILNSNPGNGQSKSVIQKWASTLELSSYIWLTVRTSNFTAKKFYDKIGFERMGSIRWKQGTIPGCVYKIKVSDV